MAGPYTYKYMRDRIAWARETLIPDLRDSGRNATAEDLEMFTNMLDQVLSTRRATGDRTVEWDPAYDLATFQGPSGMTQIRMTEPQARAAATALGVQFVRT